MPSVSKKVFFDKVVIGYLFLYGTVLFLLLNGITLYRYILDVTPQATEYFENTLNEASSNLLNNLDSFPLTPVIVTMAIWFSVGSIVYFIASYLISNATDIEEDIKVSAFYVHPVNFKKQNFIFSILLKIIYNLMAVVAFIIWLIFSLQILLPFSKTYLLIGIQKNSSIAENILSTIVSYMVSLVVVLGFMTIIKLIRTKLY